MSRLCSVNGGGSLLPRNCPMARFGVPLLRNLFDHTCGSPRRSRTTRTTGVCPLPSVQGWLCTPLPTARTVSQLETLTGTVTSIWWVFGTANFAHCTPCCVWKGGLLLWIVDRRRQARTRHTCSEQCRLLLILCMLVVWPGRSPPLGIAVDRVSTAP
jgi:hypothetical protein